MQLNYIGIIYLAINKANNKCYIGQTTKTLSCRKTQHRHVAIKKIANNKFGNAIRKYGFDTFEWYILDMANNIDNLNELEKFYIDKFKTYDFGYNSTLGGENELGRKHSKKTIEKHKISRSWYKHSEETKIKISNAVSGEKNYYFNKTGLEHPKFGKKMSETAKRAISEANSGTNHPLHGTKATPQSIEKRVSKLRKPIICLETNEIFISIKDCSRKTGSEYSSLVRHLNKHRSYSSVLNKHYEFIK